MANSPIIEDGVRDPRRPRPRGVRLTLTGAVLATLLLANVPLEGLIYDPVFGSGPLSDVLGVVLPSLFTIVVAPLVSYRRRDAVAWLIPPLGLLLTVRLVWRLTLLPYRDWPPRPEEAQRWRPTQFRTAEGAPMYLTASSQQAGTAVMSAG
jgi:hypothetical protein